MKAGAFSTSKEETYVLLAVIGLATWFVFKGIKGAAVAVGEGAAAVGGAVADVASNAVGMIGAAAGLPTPDNTINDPLVVRWIMDHVSGFAASKWGTADAYLLALWMQPGSGDQSPPPAAVLAALGVAPSVPLPVVSGSVIDYTTGAGAVPGFGGPSFNDVAAGQPSIYNPLFGLGG